MGKAVAIDGATIQALVNDPSGSASYTIMSGKSTKTKVTNKAVLLDGTKIQVKGMSVPGTQVAPAVFTLSSTAQKTKFDNKAPILMGDMSDQVSVDFQVGNSKVSQPVTLTVTNAGQQKVMAM